jgi:tripartite-type tricarboxylate transporter receptor subunit TctC
VREATGLDYEAEIWWGLLAPRGAPPALIQAVGRAARDALAEPEVSRIYEAEGARPAHSTPEAFAENLRTDLTRYREVAQVANIRLE